jgi:PAS domain S-box-containing protein
MRQIQPGISRSVAVERSRARSDITRLEFEADALAAVSDAVIAIDAEQRITYWGPGAARMYGLTEAEALGSPLSHSHTYEWSGLAEEEEAHRALREHGRWRGENTHVLRDGRRLRVESVVSILPGGRGLLAVIRDVTEAREAEARRRAFEAQLAAEAVRREELFRRERAAREEAERAGQLLELLLAIVGHDLRSPLQVVDMTTKLLFREGGLAPKQAERLVRIARSAERMRDVISDLLDVSRARRGRLLDVEPEDASVSEIVRNLVGDLASTHPSREIEVDAEEDCRATVDPRRVRQLVGNLVMNALQHADAEARVRVTVRRGDAAVRIAVANDGTSIPPERLGRLFEPYARSESRDRSGLGLGLYIVREIARAHGGTVDVSSDPRTGTVFTATFPQGPAAERASSPR